MVFVTNRFSVHAITISLVFVVVALNIHADQVRAETFGEKSLLYAMVNQDDYGIVEETAIDESFGEYAAVSYRENIALSGAIGGVDFIGAEDDALLVGGSSLSAITSSDGAASVAPRQDIELYVVQQGDTLSTIAQQFGITLNTLLWANNLRVTSTIGPGDELDILPVSGVTHDVKSGDTVAAIAQKYDADVDEIVAFNRLASASDIVVNETLIIPGGEIQVVTPTRTSTISSVISTPTTTVTTPTTSTTPTAITGSVTGTGTMIWPTDLRIITQYYGWSHTGIDIDCHYDNDNYAADDGIVQFVGWKGGYGYTVEINHGNGLVTRYAHHASLYVTQGQSVTKGQAVGRCGTTGRSTGTHIHFEVIANGSFRNPLEYIR